MKITNEAVWLCITRAAHKKMKLILRALRLPHWRWFVYRWMFVDMGYHRGYESTVLCSTPCILCFCGPGSCILLSIFQHVFLFHVQNHIRRCRCFYTCCHENIWNTEWKTIIWMKTTSNENIHKSKISSHRVCFHSEENYQIVFSPQ